MERSRKLKLYIVTGSSRGIGYSICENLLKEGIRVIGLSRSANSKLYDIAKLHNAQFDFFSVDLTKTFEVLTLLKNILENLENDINQVCLVNNAATINPIEYIGDWKYDEVRDTVALNIQTPIMLINEFVKNTKDKNFEKIIVNISSGIANKSIKGWGMYGISKAVIDRITMSLAHEQSENSNPVKIFSFYPGMVDTDMQRNIRNSDHEKFDFVKNFKNAKLQGKLLSAEKVAIKLISIINKENYKSGDIINIKNID